MSEVNFPDRSIPVDQLHYDRDFGLHQRKDCAEVQCSAYQTTTARHIPEHADPTWYPVVLRILARDYPDLSDTLWAITIRDTGGYMGVLRGLAQDHPSTSDQIWQTAVTENAVHLHARPGSEDTSRDL